jgi:uncharacterized repeat protein (TIGR03803 family)
VSRYRIAAIAAFALLVDCQGATSSFAAPGASQQSSTSGYRLLVSFNGTNGDVPYGPLTPNGTSGPLYGDSLGGGTYDNGTMFAVTAAGKLHVVHNFDRIDGANPNGGFVSLHGALYGTTSSGGTCYPDRYGCGTVFKLTRLGKERVIYNFPGTARGSQPKGQLVAVHGMLYGTTNFGGAHSSGTVFSITPDGKEHILYSFKGFTDGSGLNGGLVFLNGQLFGTTAFGGAGCNSEGCGTVFSVTPGGTKRTVYAFKGGLDGALPDSGLTVLNGTLYGETYRGGSCGYGLVGCGTAFTLTPRGEEHVLYSFGGSQYDGQNPSGGLTIVNGVLYGVTPVGGTSGAGTVFALTTGGAESLRYSFEGSSKGPDGAYPMGRLTFFRGALYGTTQGGGAYGDGTIFAVTPGS